MSGVKAYILVVTSLGLEYDIADELVKMSKDVKVSVDVVFGEYDLVVTVEGRDLKDIDKFVTMLRRVNGVHKTSTLIASRS
ncbi:MAG: Lrp/AsnC ligand binding domain-containing protein [Zestosphaera sp.]